MSKHFTARAATAAFVLAALPADASAVVVFGAVGMDAPTHGFVGAWNGSTAVAVGDQWILTAAHVGGSVKGRFTLNGEKFRGVERFVNKDADLALVRVDGLLPGWHAITADVSRKDEVLLAGAGRVAGADVRDGYKWSNTKELTWGANVVESTSRGRITLEFDADRRGALAYEAGFAMNDSGGGVFTVSETGELLLAGIARGVSELNVTRRGSLSYAVLLADHLDWIASILGEQADWYAGWLEAQEALLAEAEFAEPDEFGAAIKAQTPAPGAFAVLFGAGVFTLRRRSR
jgi:hypothetical protein